MVEIDFRKFVQVSRVGGLPLVPSDDGENGRRWRKQPTSLILVGIEPRVWADCLLGRVSGWSLTGPHAWLGSVPG